MEFDIKLAIHILPQLIDGLGVTLALILPSMLLGFLLAVPIAGARLSSAPALSSSAWLFTMFFRGTPTIVILYLVYNGLATLPVVRNTFLWHVFAYPYQCAVIGLTLNHAAFASEILRGGFHAVPHGLHDAGRALALSRLQIFFKITLPVGFRYSLSAYLSEVVLFAKSTAAVSAITVTDLLAAANEVVSMTYDPFTPLVMAGAIYWALVQLILEIFRRVESRLNRHLSQP